MLPGEQEIKDAHRPRAGAYHKIDTQHKELSACQCSMGVGWGDARHHKQTPQAARKVTREKEIGTKEELEGTVPSGAL